MWIRPYEPADAAGCAEVFLRAVHVGAAAHYTAEQRDAWAPRDGVSAAAMGQKLSAAHCFVAHDDGVQGFMSLLCQGTEGYLDMAYVAPKHRGTGVSGQLYAAILNAAYVQKIVFLRTHASHLARPFFLRRGWSIRSTEVVERRGVGIERFEMFIDL